MGDDGGRRWRVVLGVGTVAVFVAVFIVIGDRCFVFDLLSDDGMRVLEARLERRGGFGAFMGLVVLVGESVGLD